MIDLRDELYSMIHDYGQYALLVRSDIYQTCRCVSSIDNSPNDKCPICLGTGVLNKVERVLLRREGVSASAIISKYLQYEDIGDVSQIFTKFYFDFRARPKQGDVIILCDWSSTDPNIPIITDYTLLYVINYAEPLRADDGRIEFFFTLAKSDSVNNQIKLDQVIRNAKTDDYYITVRRNDV